MDCQPDGCRAALSGPISGGDQAANIQAFRDAATVLRGERWVEVYSPIDLPGTEACAAESKHLIEIHEDYTQGPLYRDLLRACFHQILKADMLYVLPGWRASAGARGEIWLARAVGAEVRFWHPEFSQRDSFDGQLVVGITDIGSRA